MEKNYRISCEIELTANSPLEAAKNFQKTIEENSMQYYVQDVETDVVVSVDLEEEDEDAVLPVNVYHSSIES